MGESYEPYVLLNNVVKRLYPGLVKKVGKEGREPFGEEVMEENKTIGMLLLLIENISYHQKVHGVGSVLQKKLYDVQENGLLTRPVPIDRELVHGRILAYYDEKIKIDKKEEENQLNYESNCRNEELKERLKHTVKYSKNLSNHCDDVIASAQAIRTNSRAAGRSPSRQQLSSRYVLSCLLRTYKCICVMIVDFAL